MSEESVEAIFQHACEGAAESIGSTRVDWQRVVDAIRFLRRELEAAKQWGADLSNELTHRTTKLAEARLWLDSSESALQEAQRALFRWLPNRIGSEYDDLIAADAMALMGLESTEGLREVGGEILIELMQKRRLLDDARAQEPCAYMFVDDLERFLESETFAQAYSIPVGAPDRGHSVPLYAASPVPAQPAAIPAGWLVQDVGHRVSVCWDGAGYTLDDRRGPIEEAFCGFVRDVVKSAAARPQPAAVPEAVAKDWVPNGWLIRPLNDGAIQVRAPDDRVEIGYRFAADSDTAQARTTYKLLRALLSAADTEVKK